MRNERRHLEYLFVALDQSTGQPSSVASGPLDPDASLHAVPIDPGEQRVMPTLIVRELPRCQNPAELVNDSYGERALVRVEPITTPILASFRQPTYDVTSGRTRRRGV
jgi:hypothetical protein